MGACCSSIPRVNPELTDTIAPSAQPSAAAETEVGMGAAGPSDGLDPAVRRALTQLDARLIKSLRAGDIRLLRTEWLLRQPGGYLLQSRQELEALERAGASPTPLLSPAEGAALIERGDRSVGPLTYPWVTDTHPDPTGERLRVICTALSENPNIRGCFIDQCCIYQHPAGGRRTDEEEASFCRALGVMADLYASAVGTTVLQFKEIPPRPREFEGALALFGLAEGADEAKIRSVFSGFGEVTRVTVGGWPPAIVRFSMHEAAVATLGVGPDAAVCSDMSHLYKETPYDEKGWCCFEDSTSSELLIRLQGYPKMRALLDKLPPKMLSLSSSQPATAVEPSIGQLDGRVERIVARIQAATFRSDSDTRMVPRLYMDYVTQIAKALTTTLAAASGEEAAVQIPPVPSVAVPPAEPPRLADGQLLLLIDAANGDDGARLAVVDGATARHLVGEGSAELSFDGCSQAVIPWRPAVDADAALRRDLPSLAAVDERVRRLCDEAARPPSEEGLRTIEEESAGIVADAARLPTMAAAAEEAGKAIGARVDEAQAALADLGRKASVVAGMSSGEIEKKTLERKHRAEAALNVRMDAVRASVRLLRSEEMVATAWRTGGAVGVRHYATGQRLAVRTVDGTWSDATVEETHVSLDGGGSTPSSLHPWNHAPLEVPRVAFEALHAWHIQALHAQHSHIADALSGRRLDALQQCVAIEVAGDDAAMSSVVDARSLAARLRALHEERLAGGEAARPPATLMTAGPAAGKTTLLTQLVALLHEGELVPILIKVQRLQQRLVESPDAFRAAWNLVDAYLGLEHGVGSPLHRMLRQTMMARRALILLDGLDEGGAYREAIERHVAEVLAPQGHVLLATSRPAGVDEARFAAFYRIRLSPLTWEQQEQALLQRLGERSATLLPYVRERVPIDTETGRRVTANPLMLSMVASVFELRTGLEMPTTVAELYEVASDVMLARGGAASTELRKLLQAVFFEAQVSQRRVIEDRQLDEAALGLERPEALAAIRARAKEEVPLPPYEGDAELGHVVEVEEEVEEEVAKGGWGCCGGRRVRARRVGSKRGVITKGGKDEGEWEVTFADGKTRDWLKPDRVHSSGLDETAFLVRAMAERADDVRSACDTLPAAMRDALAEVRRRVARDELPLLSLLQTDPLQLQSSHLSFQEYFAARAICEEGTRLSGTPPWKWPAGWANVLSLGTEMGEPFAKGLKRAAGIEGDTLDLSGKLGGDPPTALRAVALFSSALKELGLGGNQIGAEGAKALASALEVNTALTELSLFANQIGDSGAKAIGDALVVNTALNKLFLGGNKIGDWGAKAIGDALVVNSALTELWLGDNQIGDSGAKAIGDALLVNTALNTLFLSHNQIGDSGAKAIGDALVVNTALTTLVLGDAYGGNKIGDQGAIAIADALKVNSALNKLFLTSNKIGDAGATTLADALKVNTALSKLGLTDNNITDAGKQALRAAKKQRSAHIDLDLLRMALTANISSRTDLPAPAPD